MVKPSPFSFIKIVPKKERKKKKGRSKLNKYKIIVQEFEKELGLTAPKLRQRKCIALA